MSKKTNRPEAKPAAKKAAEQPAVQKPPLARPAVKEASAAALPSGQSVGGAIILAVCTALYFLLVCLSSASTVKVMTLVLVTLALVSGVIRFKTLRERVTVPLLLLAAFVAVGGVSTLYAVSGKFALYEFLKLLASFCLGIVLLAWAPGDAKCAGKFIAKILAGFAAIAAFISIDMISTRLFSGLVLGLLGQFTPDYTELAVLEAGARITSIFDNPNVFAGVAGLGVLLSLGLVLAAENKNERIIQTVILYINSLGFLLAFSMGASASIAVAFVVLLLLRRKGERAGLIILMAETLVCTVLAAAVISVTSFKAWTGVQPVPLLCLVAGAAALCAADSFLGLRLTQLLDGHKKLSLILAGGLLAVLIGFVALAFNLTGADTLSAGETLRRAAYPDPGAYTLTVASDAAVNVTVESQNQQETMMHTNTLLYQGDAATASFTVPEGSKVVYFNFSAPAGATIQTASFSGSNGSGDIPLGYKLLPGFIANRMQGLWANENAIQRLVFFSDGLKLFHRSPVYGLGLGAFENGVKSVQSFAYITRYAHNHYIQTLAETGLIGLALFVLLLLGSFAAAVCERGRGEETHPLAASLGAAVVFMAIHAASEVVFSMYSYLPIAFGTFMLLGLCCGEALPAPKLNLKAKAASLLVIAVLILAFTALLVCNMQAKAIADAGNSYEAMDKAIALDKFEWADYALSYVVNVPNMNVTPDIKLQADKYAERLGKMDSNTVPVYLAAYYFQTDRPNKAMNMLEKYVNYVSSDAEGWQKAFDVLLQFEDGSDEFRVGVRRIAALLDEWNAANLGEITVNDAAQALIERAGA